MLALLSLTKSKWRMPYNTNNVFEIVSVVNEAHSSVFWRGSAWLLEWSEQSINQYDCSRLLLKSLTRACVEHDCCSSARAVLKGTPMSLGLRPKRHGIGISAETALVYENATWFKGQQSISRLPDFSLEIKKKEKKLEDELLWLTLLWECVISLKVPWKCFFNYYFYITLTLSFSYLLWCYTIKYGSELCGDIKMPFLAQLHCSRGSRNCIDPVIIISYSLKFHGDFFKKKTCFIAAPVIQFEKHVL